MKGDFSGLMSSCKVISNGIHSHRRHIERKRLLWINDRPVFLLLPKLFCLFFDWFRRFFPSLWHERYNCLGCSDDEERERSIKRTRLTGDEPTTANIQSSIWRRKRRWRREKTTIMKITNQNNNSRTSTKKSDRLWRAKWSATEKKNMHTHTHTPTKNSIYFQFSWSLFSRCRAVCLFDFFLCNAKKANREIAYCV